MSPSKDNISKGITSSLFGRISDLFPKAANIIGHAMNLDGLMFFDAVDTGARDRGSRSSNSFTYGKSAPHVNEKVQSWAQPLSEYQGDVTAESQMVDRPSQSLIQRLTAAYPHGYVFTVDEYGVFEPSFQGMEVGQGLSDTSAIHGEWKELFDCIPKARYAIFLPLWHYQRESCFATCLAWVSDPGKTLETNDINSLTAFGNSLMAKIYRLEAATSTQQKSDFVSSVSHELRSPLHGILATVELMQENMDDSRLLSMTQMIESCSYTLLDTFDHLLEFSKINSLKGGRESAARDEGNADSPHTQKLAIDLGSLVEDVLQTVSLGHNSASQIELRLKNEHQNSPASGVEVPPLPVLITTYIDHNLEWTSHMDRGAWKRILLNILSNALRFTESGHIDVTLKMLEGADAGTRCISLSVTDTGVGMSPEFLKYHLFTPFMQENSLVSGTGLGLSIVKSIVESLEGKIFVESHQHEGTCVTVNIPLHKELGTPSQSDAVGSLGLGDRMPNLTVSVISIASQRAPNNKSALNVVALPELLQRCLRNICEKHFGMTVVVDIPWNALLKQDIVLLDAHGISSTEIFDFQWQFPEVVSAMASRPVVVLGPTTKGMEQFFTREGATFISSAITRKNLWDGIITALNKMVPPAAIPCCMSSVNSRQPSHQAEAPIQGGLLEEDEPIATQSKPVNLPMRSASPQAGVGAKGVATSPPRSRQQSPLYPLHTIMADSPDSHLIYRYRRLLLVDDNPINLKLLVAFAKRIGLPFATAFDGAEAVRLYKKAIEEEADPFDCVFMDISMPVMDSFQATVAIRQFEEQQRKEHQDRDANTYKKKSQDEGDNEQQKETPLRAVRSNIMAFTGLGSEKARSMARNSGFDLFLVKPLKFKDVEPLLRHLPVNSEGSLLLNLE
jgi:signal transduction histidine kinase